MIQAHYRHDKSEAKFDNVMDAVKDALYHSERNDHCEVEIKRCVLYTGMDEWKETTMTRISMPQGTSVSMRDTPSDTSTTPRVHSNLKDTMRIDDPVLKSRNPDIEMF